MSEKTTKNDVVVDVDVNAIVKIVKDDEGYHCVQPDGTSYGPLKIIEEGRTLVLPKNPANRQYCAVKKADEGIAENGEFILTVRTTPKKDVSTYSTKLPNEKLIAYLPEAEQEEYKAIIARAIAARDADREANKKKPMTETEKAQAKVTKLVAKLKEMGVSDEDIKALIEKNANKEVENDG